MINTTRVIKVSLLWMTIVYTICFLGVAAFPDIRSWFMFYGLHTIIDPVENIATIGTFISGLIIWDSIAFLGVWLFAFLFNKIKN